MGYYTNFNLRVAGIVKCYEPFAMRSMTDDEADMIDDAIDNTEYFEDGNVSVGWWVDAKWYHYESDMCELSEKLPNVVFALHGEGEVADDMWVTYFLNGHAQNCPAKIIYDPFDASCFPRAPLCNPADIDVSEVL